jgi:hypothetical protein
LAWFERFYHAGLFGHAAYPFVGFDGHRVVSG